MLSSEEKFARRRLRTTYLSSVISIALVLFMLGLLGLILLNAKKLSDYVKENVNVSLIFREKVNESEILKFKAHLDSSYFVRSSKYVTKEEAAIQLKEDLGEDFIKTLGYNPLLPSIDIRLKAEFANNASISIIEKKLLENENIKEVFYQKSIINLVNDKIRKISIVLIFFSIILLVISIALINNTIRLSVYSKRFLIRSMMLVGATQYFVRKPFVLKGIVHGLYGALIAILFFSGTIYFIVTEIPELMYMNEINVLAEVFGIVVLLGLLISYISTIFAVRKYLRLKTDDLYYY
ncbi:MAG: permease-like cell division protein FtsX [Bacteroidales bacterium]|jgi:cell division transport system permease protein